MPVIQLEVSERVRARWQQFLGSQPAGRLLEAGLLGDWVAMAFMAQVESFLKHGLPDGAEDDERAKQDQKAVDARKRLSKPQRQVLNMFNENDNQTPAEISRLLGTTEQEARQLAESWVSEGFLAPGPERDQQPTYVLSPRWQEINLAANRPSLNAPRAPHLLRPRQNG